MVEGGSHAEQQGQTPSQKGPSHNLVKNRTSGAQNHCDDKKLATTNAFASAANRSLICSSDSSRRVLVLPEVSSMPAGS